MSDLSTRFAELGAASTPHVGPPPPLGEVVALARRRRRRRAAGAGLGSLAAALLVTVGLASVRGGPDLTQPAPAAPSTSPPTDATQDGELTPEQVDDLTRPGRGYADGDELDLADRAFVQRWGGVRPEVVSDAINEVCEQHLDACGGYSYEADTLTFVLLVKPGAVDATDLAEQAAAAYDATNGDANFRFETAHATYSLPEADALVAEINEPDKRRPELVAAGFEEGSFGARYLAGDGELVVVLVATPQMKAFFEDLYGDRVSVQYPDPDSMTLGDGFAPR